MDPISFRPANGHPKSALPIRFSAERKYFHITSLQESRINFTRELCTIAIMDGTHAIEKLSTLVTF